ncbi:MAG: acyltransferase family protein [Gemmatimonadaceae bacterium]
MSEPSGTLTSPPKRQRILALDVFRGLTVAGMLLVNDPGTWSAIYPPLEHAEWNGWTPTDVIFPFFLFIAGVTTHLSLSARRAQGADDKALQRQIIRRGALIVLFGLFMAVFPFYPLDRITHLRIPGVLQRIGVAYAIAALISLRTTLKQQAVIVASILIGYWFVMTLVPVPGAMGGIGANLNTAPARTLAAWTDRFLLGGHLWINSVTWDPEGPLSTIPAIGTAMLGIFAGRWLAEPRPLDERLNGLFAVGALGMMAGLMWNWSFPINKSLWTSSFVVFTAGMACVSIAAISWVIDVKRVTWWTRPVVIYGVNPIIAFVGSGLMERMIYTVWKVNFHGVPTPVQAVVYESVFRPMLAPRNASLAFAISFVLLWYLILWALARKNIIFKV